MDNQVQDAVARLTAALDGVPDTERVCVTDEWNRVVLFVSETPGKLRDIYVRDLREVLAAYADAARDAEYWRTHYNAQMQQAHELVAALTQRAERAEAALADAARDRERVVEDEARMEWLEQSRMGPMDAADLITEWRWNGKRYAGGLRSAVDAAMEKERAARTGEAR